MVDIMKPGKVVIVLSGRFAGKKAVIIDSTVARSSPRTFGRVLIFGLFKSPLKMTSTMSEIAKVKKSSVKIFVKIMNSKHLLPTRYKLKVEEIKKINIEAKVYEIKKVKMLINSKKIFEDKFKSGESKW